MTIVKWVPKNAKRVNANAKAINIEMKIAISLKVNSYIIYQKGNEGFEGESKPCVEARHNHVRKAHRQIPCTSINI